MQPGIEVTCCLCVVPLVADDGVSVLWTESCFFIFTIFPPHISCAGGGERKPQAMCLLIHYIVSYFIARLALGVLPSAYIPFLGKLACDHGNGQLQGMVWYGEVAQKGVLDSETGMFFFHVQTTIRRGTCGPHVLLTFYKKL